MEKWAPVFNGSGEVVLNGNNIMVYNVDTGDIRYLERTIENVNALGVVPNLCKENESYSNCKKGEKENIAPSNDSCSQKSSRDYYEEPSKSELKLWTEESDLFLIQMVIKFWEEIKNSSRRRVFEKIARLLCKAFGKKYTGSQADTKWKYLIARYKDMKQKMSTSGMGQVKWAYWDVMHDFLHTKVEITPAATCSSIKGLEVNSNQSSDAESSISSPTVSSMTRKRARREEGLERRHKDKMARIDKLQESVDALVAMLKEKKENS